MHGLGDTGAGWSAISENFRLRRKFDEVAFIFPHAPKIPITCVRHPRTLAIRTGELGADEQCAEHGMEDARVVRHCG